MQHSQNKHWRERVKPGSSFFSQMLPYATGAAIGATLTAALLWGTHNAGRTRGYSSAPDSQQQVVQQENYRFKKTTDKPSKTAAKAPATNKTATASHGEQRNDTANRDPLCSSDYPKFKLINQAEIPEKIVKGSKVLCSYVGDFDGDGEDELVGLAVVTDADNPTKYKVGMPFFYFYETPGKGGSEGYGYGMKDGIGSSEDFTDFQLKRFYITNVGIDRLPQLIVEFSTKGKNRLQILIYKPRVATRLNSESKLVIAEGESFLGYRQAGFAEGDRFHFEDLDGDGVKELITINGGKITGAGVVKRPVTVLSWAPFSYYQDGVGLTLTPKRDGATPIVYERSYLDRPFGPVVKTQSKLAEAAISGNSSEILRIKDASNPYVFVAASMGLFDFSAVTDKLFADLYAMEPSAFLEQLLSNPPSAGIILGATFAERFIHHVRTRNDHMIGQDPARGYTVTYDGQVYSGYGSKEDARRAIVDAEKRKHEEANRPSAYHTFRSTTTDPRSGVTTETRSTSVGGPPQTPTQWETNRAVNKDPIARGIDRAYQGAGAVKGEAEKKAGEVSRNVGRALNEAAGNIGRAIEDAKRRR